MMDNAAQEPCWIAVDWGTTRLRVWAMGCDGAVIGEQNSDRGMSSLERSQYAPVLKAMVGDLAPDRPDIPIVACGMVGSRQGWAEAGYIAVPCPPPGLSQAVKPADAHLSVHILAGVKQLDPPDVMRGEETQIAGYLRQRPDFDGVICLPGTHAKWVHVRGGEIVRFQSYMTGELYALLSQRSVLRPGMATSGWDNEAFLTGVDDAMARPVEFSGQLFALRASTLIGGMGPEAARSRLSGLLIGLELAAARPCWQGREVIIIGRNDLARLYMAGLRAHGSSPAIVQSADMALAGLTAAFEKLTETIT
jgi:2-dehydro-3-deoxygalactonokinase